MSTPWLDAKYSKRLRRLFFIYAINNLRPNIRFLSSINRIAIYMYSYIITNNPIYLQLINIISRYDLLNGDFLRFVNSLMNNHQNFVGVKFADDIFYFNQLDELINTMFFIFGIFYFYRIGRAGQATIPPITDDVLTFNIINYLRSKFLFYNFTDMNNDFNILYINKIEKFFKDIIDETTSVIDNINLIWANLPPAI
jgi:hypothetical protein